MNNVTRQLSILDVISEHVDLKKVGPYYAGHCPFRQSNIFSFAVTADTGLYYCFECKKGGDAISFISQLKNCTQIEALKMLAEKYKIDIPEIILIKI